VDGSDFCEITRTAGDFPEGKENVGTASVTDLEDQTDPAWYQTPTLPAYTFEKYVDDEEADTLPDAVQVDAGDTLTFKYEVSNTGNVPIQWTGLTDSVFGDLTAECGDFPRTIPVDGSDFCEITRTAGDFPRAKRTSAPPPSPTWTTRPTRPGIRPRPSRPTLLRSTSTTKRPTPCPMRSRSTLATRSPSSTR